MSNAARKQPLILVSEDHDPDIWRSLDEEETSGQAWLAIAQDIWGRGNVLPDQAAAMREAAIGLSIDKTRTIGAVGRALGGVAALATQHNTYIELFECDEAFTAHLAAEPGAAGKFLRPAAWSPDKPALRADRYHGLIAARAFSASADPAATAAALAAAVKPGGRLFIDDLYAPDPSVAALVAQAIATPNAKLTLHSSTPLMETLEAAKFEPRAKVVVNDQLMRAIRAGLAQATTIATRLKAIPQPFRKQRLEAFADELQRVTVLHHALEKGLVTAMRTIHYKAREL
jgi:hypothetical protein